MNVNVQILGQYDFENFTLLNALMGKEERINTAIHEYTHFVLANQSVYGTIQYCLNKIIIPPDCNADIIKRKAAMNFFMDSTLKVQEGLAVFIEATYFMLRSNTEYENFIGVLRNGNKLYYGYVKPLVYILEYMKEVEYESKLTIAHAVFQIALKSMNSNIYDFEGKQFATNKSIKKMISGQDFSKNYLPNKRFQTMIESCKKETSYDDFCKKLLDCAKMEDEHSVGQYRDRLDKIKVFVLGVFEDSSNLEMYKSRLAQINIKEEDSSSVFLQQLPSAFNEEYVQKNMKKIGYEALKQKCKTSDYSTLFLLGGLKNNISDLLIKMGVVDIPKMEETREMIFFYDLKKKEIFGCFVEKNELREVIEQNDNKCVLLTAYKNYDYENDCLPNHHAIKDNIYIYCDRTYSNTIPYIRKWADRSVFYRYMVYESMIVLLVKINATTLFMLPMTPVVADEAEKDIRINYPHMQAITEVGDEEYDPYIIKDEKIRNEIDTIINCLFFINLPVPNEE